VTKETKPLRCVENRACETTQRAWDKVVEKLSLRGLRLGQKWFDSVDATEISSVPVDVSVGSSLIQIQLQEQA